MHGRSLSPLQCLAVASLSRQRDSKHGVLLGSVPVSPVLCSLPHAVCRRDQEGEEQLQALLQQPELM